MCSSSSLDLHRIFTLTGEILLEINYTRFYDPSESNSGIKAPGCEDKENQGNSANTPADM
jgi:hypothetical protein